MKTFYYAGMEDGTGRFCDSLDIALETVTNWLGAGEIYIPTLTIASIASGPEMGTLIQVFEHNGERAYIQKEGNR